MDLRLLALLVPASLAAALVAVRGVHAVEGEAGRLVLLLALATLAALVAALAAVRRDARRRPVALPPAADAVLRGATTALGDAALAFDERGRLIWANPAAVALSGYSEDALVGRTREVLGPDVAVLLRGLARGHALGRVEIPAPGAAALIATAAAVRVPGPSPVDVLVLRGETGEWPGCDEVTEADLVPEPVVPPPLPAARAALTGAGSSAGRGERAVLPVDELREPLARALAEAALLRMILPIGTAGASERLARLERALRDAEATLAALAEPVAAASPERVELDAAMGEALAATRLPSAVKVERVGEVAGAAFADPGHLRQALHHLLRAAAQAMPSGGVLTLRTVRRGREVAIELGDSGVARAAAPGLDLSLARRLVAAQGGRLERSAVAGRGTVVRVVLPAAARADRAAVL